MLQQSRVPAPVPGESDASSLPPSVAANYQRIEAATARLAIASARDAQNLLTQAQAQGRSTLEAGQLLRQIATAARSAAQGAQEVAASTEQAASAADTGTRAMAGVRDATALTVQAVTQAQAEMAQLIGDSTRIDQVVKLIERIASQTNLLALNASIEAARAGAHGRSFAVVAQGIRQLAEDTARQAGQIRQLMGSIRDRVNRAEQLVGECEQQAEAAAGQGERGSAAIVEIAGFMHSTAQQVAEIAAANEQLMSAVEGVESRVKALGQSAQESIAQAEAAVDSEGVQGATEEIFEVLGEHRYGGLLEEMLDVARTTAREAETILAGLLDSGALRLEQVQEWSYTEAVGPVIQRLQRLFDVRRVPSTGFVPPKFVTSWDHLVDVPFRSLTDRATAMDRRIVFVTIPDVNGYHAAHLSQHCRDWTGDPAVDAVGNRAKRFFDSPVALRGARVGIPGGMRVPLRASREQFRAAGVDPDRLERPDPFLLQTYARDTGDIIHQLSIPLFVRGRRFGAVRMGFLTEQAADRAVARASAPLLRLVARR